MLRLRCHVHTTVHKTHPHTLPCVCFVPQLAEVTTRALERLPTFNRRTLDVIAARLYSYHSWAYECLGKLEDIRRWVSTTLKS